MAAKLPRGLCRVALLGVLIAIQGCREDEQDRVLLFEPGVYQGQEDPPLAEERVNELRSRARQQQF